MSTLIDLNAFETRRIRALLDRLDPTPHLCEVPGCVHLGVAHDGDTPPAVAA